MAQQLSQLEMLREEFATYLRGRGAFQGIAVVTRQDANIVRTIENEIGRVGISVEVFIKSARPTQSMSDVVMLNPVVLGLAVYENVLINQDPATGTGRGAFLLIEAALAAAKQWKAPDFCGVFMPDAAGLQHGKSDQQPNMLILLHDFTTIVQLAPRSV